VQATFATKTAFVVSAERNGRIKLAVSVCPNNSSARLADDFRILLTFVGPDTGAQSVWRVVHSFGLLLPASEMSSHLRPSEDFLDGISQRSRSTLCRLFEDPSVLIDQDAQASRRNQARRRIPPNWRRLPINRAQFPCATLVA
jgi:hypothetical protein